MEMEIWSFEEAVDSAIRSESGSEFGESPVRSFSSFIDIAIRSDNSSEEDDFIASPSPLHALAVECVLPNGDIYFGILSGNVPHGTGKYVWSDGQMYEGEWKKGKACGKWRYTMVICFPGFAFGVMKDMLWILSLILWSSMIIYGGFKVHTLKNLISRDDTTTTSATPPQNSSRSFSFLSPFRSNKGKKIMVA
ncbi:hypothetical protein VNO78_30821 [Psophocarpus tetragonolobus]|uniref:Uncharacterized protein n=1 Tax=Psophocarpus tetragonolobus TaxID=3891 RepID=A0AAN9X692_PSOTE